MVATKKKSPVKSSTSSPTAHIIDKFRTHLDTLEEELNTVGREVSARTADKLLRQAEDTLESAFDAVEESMVTAGVKVRQPVQYYD